jgi:acylphosphatase
VSHSYSSDVEGGAPVCLRYVIEGQMGVPDYLAFVAERARWFGVSGWAEASADGRVTLVAAGPEAMVGALEMACTLGPLNALVERIEGVAEDAPVGVGFEVR